MVTEKGSELEGPSTLPFPSDADRWVPTAGEPGRTTLSPFDRAVNAELNRLATLEPGWDAEGADRIDGRVISAARQFVSALPGRLKEEAVIPAVVPLRKGNLQFEWHDGPRTLELEFEAPEQIHYLKWHSAAGIEEEDIRPMSHVETFVELIRWFMKR
jgi:hypothetical protein